MGYNGMGYQRWIATMKPKKFLQKRSKPDGGGMKNDSGTEIRNYFHVQKNNLENLVQRKYSESYKSAVNQKFQTEKRRDLLINLISLIISIIIIAAVFFYMASKMGWF